MLEWVDDDRNCDTPPTRFMFPYHGDGMTVNGRAASETPPESISVGECGEWYGYCYQPEIHVKSSFSDMYTASSFSEHGYNPELQGELHSPMGHHPFFAKQEDAVRWLKDRGLTGQVQRYAHHKPVDQRGPKWDYDPLDPTNRRSDKWHPYHPWITAGVSDIITERKDTAITTPLGLSKGFTLHEPDGTSRQVGGKGSDS